MGPSNEQERMLWGQDNTVKEVSTGTVSHWKVAAVVAGCCGTDTGRVRVGTE